MQPDYPPEWDAPEVPDDFLVEQFAASAVSHNWLNTFIGDHLTGNDPASVAYATFETAAFSHIINGDEEKALAALKTAAGIVQSVYMREYDNGF